MNEACDRLAVAQAAIAPTQNAYWSSAGNPLSDAIVEDAPVTESYTALPPSDAEKLLDQTAELIQDALNAMERGKAWKTASLLETALQQISNHRTLNAPNQAGNPQF